MELHVNEVKTKQLVNLQCFPTRSTVQDFETPTQPWPQVRLAVATWLPMGRWRRFNVPQ